MFLGFHILWLLGGSVRNVKFNDVVIHNDHFHISHAKKASMGNSWDERASHLQLESQKVYGDVCNGVHLYPVNCKVQRPLFLYIFLFKIFIYSLFCRASRKVGNNKIIFKTTNIKQVNTTVIKEDVYPLAGYSPFLQVQAAYKALWNNSVLQTHQKTRQDSMSRSSPHL